MNTALNTLPCVETDQVNTSGQTKRIFSLKPLPKRTPELLERKVAKLKTELKKSQDQTTEMVELLGELMAQLEAAKTEAREVSDLKADLKESHAQYAKLTEDYLLLQTQYLNLVRKEVETPCANVACIVPMGEGSSTAAAWLDGL
jgi:seryl-tRNA synthetase